MSALSNHAKRRLRARFAALVGEDLKREGWLEEVGLCIGTEDPSNISEEVLASARAFTLSVADRIREGR